MSLNEGGLWCPECGAEYRIGFIQCADCHVDLSWEKPSRAEDLARHDVLEYDFDDWDDDRMIRLALLLRGADIPHTWEGRRLLVADVREGEVDELVAQAEHPGPRHRKRHRGSR